MRKLSDTLALDQEEGVSILFIRDNLGYHTAGDLRKAYNQIEEGQLLVDLGCVTITTSRGMATLLSIILESEDKGQQVCLSNVSPQCMNILDAMDIVTHVPGLKIFDTLDEGIEHLRQSR